VKTIQNADFEKFYRYFIVGVLEKHFGFSINNIYVRYKVRYKETGNSYRKMNLYEFYNEQSTLNYSFDYDKYSLKDTLILFTDNEKIIMFNLMNREPLTFIDIKNYIDPFINEDIVRHPNKIINKRYLKNHIFIDTKENILKVHQFLRVEFRFNSCYDIAYEEIINNLSMKEEVIYSIENLNNKLFNEKNLDSEFFNFVNYSIDFNSGDYYLYDLYLGNIEKSDEDNMRFRLFLNMKSLIIKNLNKISLIKNYVDNVCIDCMLDGYTVNMFNRIHLLKHIYELNYTRESMAQLIYKIKYLYPTLLNENLPRNKKATVSYIINVLDNGQYVFNIWSISPHILAENILYSLFKDNPDDIFNYNKVNYP